MNWIPHPQQLWSAGIFADRDAFRDLSSGFRGERAKVDGTEIAIVVLSIVAALFVFWALSRLVSWREGHGPYRNPRQLFGRLCRAHALSWKERRALIQLGRAASLSQLSMAFIRPDIFNNVAASTISHLPAGELASLYDKVYGHRH